MPPVIELKALSVKLGTHEVLRDITGSFTGRTIGLSAPTAPANPPSSAHS